MIVCVCDREIKGLGEFVKDKKIVGNFGKKWKIVWNFENKWKIVWNFEKKWMIVGNFGKKWKIVWKACDRDGRYETQQDFVMTLQQWEYFKNKKENNKICCED